MILNSSVRRTADAAWKGGRPWVLGWREMLSTMLRSEYSIVSAASAKRAVLRHAPFGVSRPTARRDVEIISPRERCHASQRPPRRRLSWCAEGCPVKTLQEETNAGEGGEEHPRARRLEAVEEDKARRQKRPHLTPLHRTQPHVDVRLFHC